MCSEGTKSAAKARYMTGEVTLQELAKETGVKLATLKEWSRKEKWVAERRSVQEEAMKKAAVRAVNKKARELCRLLAASDKLEKALLLAAQALSKYLEEGTPTGEPLTDKKGWADNLNHIVAAISKQAETRMMLSGIMARDEEEKIALMRRKQRLEERKESQERTGGMAIALDPDVEDLAL